MTAFIGFCTIEIQVPSSQSLKDKRQIVQSIKARIRNEFNVSIAETDDLDSWQLATLAVACVSGHRAYAEGVLERVVRFVERRPELVLLDYAIEWL